MSEVLHAFSPWSEVDASIITGLSPRLDTLEGKTVGLFADFMVLATHMLETVRKELASRCPTARFSFIQYTTETTDLAKDPVFRPRFDEWLADHTHIIRTISSKWEKGSDYLFCSRTSSP